MDRSEGGGRKKKRKGGTERWKGDKEGSENQQQA
jgi:hypothetical protein